MCSKSQLDMIIEKIVDFSKNVFGEKFQSVILYGSYARGEATPQSDLDFRIDKGAIKGLIALGSLYNDLSANFDKDLDLLTTGSLDEDFLRGISDEELIVYERI